MTAPDRFRRTNVITNGRKPLRLANVIAAGAPGEGLYLSEPCRVRAKDPYNAFLTFIAEELIR